MPFDRKNDFLQILQKKNMQFYIKSKFIHIVRNQNQLSPFLVEKNKVFSGDSFLPMYEENIYQNVADKIISLK